MNIFKKNTLSEELKVELDLAHRARLDNENQLERCLASRAMYEARITRLEREIAAAERRENPEPLPTGFGKSHANLNPVPTPSPLYSYENINTPADIPQDRA